jgi:ABC-type nitrate/sulfonate/bicarbonate transport system permease component
VRRLAAFARANAIGLATWAVIIGGWELAAHLVPPSHLRGSPIVPSLEFIWTDTFKSLSGSWRLHMWAPNPAYGGKETYLGAVLAIGYHSYYTLTRVLLGLAVGGILGVGSGLLVSYSRTVRWVVWGPLNFVRMVPLLAAIPLFSFWLGANTRGTTTFIAIGVWVLLVIATINAVRNVPNVYAESARTLGASRRQTYVRVVIPRALPELRTGLLLSAGLSWSLAVGSEYIGLRTGLGTIMATAEATANTGRMLIIAVLVITYALLTFALLDKLFNRMVRWMPKTTGPSARIAGGAAGLGGGVAVSRGDQLSAV